MKKKLLAWYDIHKRSLPWRAEVNQKSNPYHVYLSEILLQQTTVPTVIPYFERFIKKWPTIQSLAKASLHDILTEFQGLGYYSRAKNLHKSAQLFAELGEIPKDIKNLQQYPGIGDYTSKAILSIAFQQPFVPIDGNVIRVFARYFCLEKPLPYLKKDIIQYAETLTCPHRPGDFAQALMDFGSIICKPKNPQCFICPLKTDCKSLHKKIAHTLPKKEQKQKIPQKYAEVIIYKNGNQVLIEKNNNTGLLANLWGFPTTPFQEKKPDISKNTPFIKHTFTHFHLTLFIQEKNHIESSMIGSNQQCIDFNQIQNFPFSTLMKKVLNKYEKNSTIA